MPFEDDRYYNSRQVRERGPWGRTLYYQMVDTRRVAGLQARQPTFTS